MIRDLSLKHKEEFRKYDFISYKVGGNFVENLIKNTLVNPSNISNLITKEIFDNLLNALFFETNNPYEYKSKKRRALKFFEKTIMFYYYKEKVSTNMLEKEFSIEHIIPNSCVWNDELDKDRTGNLIPILTNMNCSRQNSHIKKYKKSIDGNEFCAFIKDIIPTDDTYDSIVSYKDRCPNIINNELYNNLCTKNENCYKNNFLHCLFD